MNRDLDVALSGEVLDGPVVTEPEAAEPWQLPYEKTDRVPEVFKPAEKALIEYFGTLYALQDGYPMTAGMLRMRDGAVLATGELVAVFEVLASEGGQVAEHAVTVGPPDAIQVTLTATYEEARDAYGLWTGAPGGPAV